MDNIITIGWFSVDCSTAPVFVVTPIPEHGCKPNESEDDKNERK
jgi:hypothetical protein